MDKRTWDKRLNQEESWMRSRGGPGLTSEELVGEERTAGQEKKQSTCNTSHERTKCSRKVDNGTSITLSNKDTTTSVESCIKTKRGFQTLAWTFADSPLEMCCFSSVTS